MTLRLDPLAKVVVASLAGLLLGWVTALPFSSSKDTSTAVVLVIAFQLLAGLSVGALTRGRKAGAAVVIFSVSLLGWPEWNGLLRQFEGLEFYGVLEVVPAMVGGFIALAVHKPTGSRHR